MRVLALFAGAFSLGIFLAQYLLPWDWLLPCAAAAFVLSLGRLCLGGKAGRRLLLVGLGLSLALGYNWLYVRQVQCPMETLAEQERSLTMTLMDYPQATDYGARVTVRSEGLPGKLVYYGTEDLLSLQPGQTVTDTVSLRSAARIRDTDITSFTSKGVFLLAYEQGEAVYDSGSMDSPRWWPVRLGRAMQTKIQELYHGDTAGFLLAYLTGDQSVVSKQAASDLSEAGIYHILAVSGLHVGFLFGLAQLLLGRHRRRLTAAVTIPMLAGYALLTGAGPSVVRACLMLTMLLLAGLFHRDSDGPTALSFALFLILLQNPFAAASVGLQLSFTAMAGMLWLTPRLYRFLRNGKQWGRVFRFVASSFAATMGALVFSLPVSAYYFGIVSLVAPLSNLLCLWAAGFIFGLGLLSVGLGAVWMPLAFLPVRLTELLTCYLLGVTHLLAQVPHHAVYMTNPYLKFWLVFVYLLFGAAYRLRSTRRRTCALAALLAGVTLIPTVMLGRIQNPHDLNAIVLDVGQGQSVLLSSGGQFALVDCGSANSWYDAGGIAADHLLTMGCRELDTLVVSHYDKDHVNGTETLLARIRVERMLLPSVAEDAETQTALLELAKAYGVAVDFVTEQKNLPFGAAWLTVFPSVDTRSDNAASLAVLASAGEEDLLITGDMDRTTEKKLLETCALPRLEYLVAGHHGSNSSTSKELLKALEPQAVCISVGRNNSYGHPAEELLYRLAQYGCTVYRTDLHGDIRLSLEQGDHHGIRQEYKK